MYLPSVEFFLYSITILVGGTEDAEVFLNASIIYLEEAKLLFG